ncbi:MAG TPA: 16S rRNA (uracil(1498)-N(3))-methyltransferase [Candidatus Binatia bacterium]|nr:16S rRNA (uracil(1498)-N(3))-methyltransferase [Candidatus Binatia bacterium]
MARFFVPRGNIEGSRGIVVGEELLHLRRVLRLAAGDIITIFDDTGREHDAVICSVGPEAAAVEITSSYEAKRESTLDLTLALGLTKGEKMDFVIEKATELGVQTIVPFISAYAVPKLNERKIAARSERWQKIALSAAKQCGRTQIPKLLPLCAFREFIGQVSPDTFKLLFWEKESTQSLRELQQHRGAKPVLITIGPEGGFSAEEAEQATKHGFHRVTLGRRILRAETAAVAALSVAQFLWGDLH